MKTQGSKKEEIKKMSKSDRKKLEVMIGEGRTRKEISQALGKSVKEILPVMKSVVVKNSNGVKVPLTKAASKNIPVMGTRDQAKEMARAARQIARSNGKRITMAMFFIEDLG